MYICMVLNIDGDMAFIKIMDKGAIFVLPAVVVWFRAYPCSSVYHSRSIFQVFLSRKIPMSGRPTCLILQRLQIVSFFQTC